MLGDTPSGRSRIFNVQFYANCAVLQICIQFLRITRVDKIQRPCKKTLLKVKCFVWIYFP